MLLLQIAYAKIENITEEFKTSCAIQLICGCLFDTRPDLHSFLLRSSAETTEYIQYTLVPNANGLLEHGCRTHKNVVYGNFKDDTTLRNANYGAMLAPVVVVDSMQISDIKLLWNKTALILVG